MGKIKISLKRSVIGSTARIKKTAMALGLRKTGAKVEVEATPQILGMVHKLNHLVEVEEVK